eukprot:2638327-Pyramimonas_sp.AAC.1
MSAKARAMSRLRFRSARLSGASSELRSPTSSAPLVGFTAVARAGATRFTAHEHALANAQLTLADSIL